MNKYVKAAAVTAGVAGLVALGEAAYVHSADKVNNRREAAIVRCAPHLGNKALTAANVPDRCQDLVTDYQDGIANQQSMERFVIPLGGIAAESLGLFWALSEPRREEIEPPLHPQPVAESV